MRSLDSDSHDSRKDADVSIPLYSTTPPMTVQLPFQSLAEPCETTIFAQGSNIHELDDEELPIHLLVYKALLQLPVDVRSVCMSRIIFVGGASSIPGLQGRVLYEVTRLVESRGWDPVLGRAADKLRLKRRSVRTGNMPAIREPTEVLSDASEELRFGATAAADAPHEPDPIEDQLRRDASKGAPSSASGTLRVVASLGAWSGASILSQLRIPAVAVVEREQWLQQGVASASRPYEINTSKQRQSLGTGGFRAGAGDRTSWTLGVWGE